LVCMQELYDRLVEAEQRRHVETACTRLP
jgi:hypothetical protein